MKIKIKQSPCSHEGNDVHALINLSTAFSEREGGECALSNKLTIFFGVEKKYTSACHGGEHLDWRSILYIFISDSS